MVASRPLPQASRTRQVWSGRLSAWAASFLYTMHLGVVLTLFLTFPYSKFAHMLYRTLALVHQRLTTDAEEGLQET